GDEGAKTEDPEGCREDAEGGDQASRHAEACSKQISIAPPDLSHDKRCRKCADGKAEIEQADGQRHERRVGGKLLTDQSTQRDDDRRTCRPQRLGGGQYENIPFGDGLTSHIKLVEQARLNYQGDALIERD